MGVMTSRQLQAARDPRDEVRPDQPVSTERQRAAGADV